MSTKKPEPELTTAPPAVPSPWLTATEAARYLKRGRQWVLREIKQGRLRGAVVGGRGEILTRREWCDQWVADHARPVEPFGYRKRTV